MSTYVLMKILESAPGRYDLGIKIITLGRINKVYDRLVESIKPGYNVLDIGCGTGNLTLRILGKGAKVVGMDINPDMICIAKQKIEKSGFKDSVEFREEGVSELSSESDYMYDAVVSGLCFSELSDDEQKYALKQIYRVLKPGGLLLLADEIQPDNFLKKLLHFLLKIPLTIITYLITQTTTSSLKNIDNMLNYAGFNIKSIDKNWMDDFILLTAEKPS